MTEYDTLTEKEAGAAFDRIDARLGRWAIFAGGTALGAMLTGVLSWIFG